MESYIVEWSSFEKDREIQLQVIGRFGPFDTIMDAHRYIQRCVDSGRYDASELIIHRIYNPIEGGENEE